MVGLLCICLHGSLFRVKTYLFFRQKKKKKTYNKPLTGEAIFLQDWNYMIITRTSLFLFVCVIDLSEIQWQDISQGSRSNFKKEMLILFLKKQVLQGMETYVNSFYPSYFLHVGRHEQTHKTMRSQNQDHCYFVQEF